MRRYDAREKVSKGYYLDVRSLEFVTVGQAGGRLPDRDDARFIRVPWVALLILAPPLGVSFVFFLPALAFVGLAYYAALGLIKVTRRGVASVASLAVSGFAPGEATLARRWKIGQDERKVEPATATEPTDDRLAELEREIAARRGEGVDGDRQ
jgi:hypothetical protein